MSADAADSPTATASDVTMVTQRQQLVNIQLRHRACSPQHRTTNDCEITSTNKQHLHTHRHT